MQDAHLGPKVSLILKEHQEVTSAVFASFTYFALL